MPTLGSLVLGPIPRIAAPLSDGEVRTHADAARRHADLVELRIDRFARRDAAHVADTCRAARTLGLPLIATVRTVEEGGAVQLADAERLALFRAAAPLVDGFDIELHAAIRDPVVAVAKQAGRIAIVSHHDLSRTPSDDDLAALFDAAVRAGADVVKVAAHAAGPADADRLLGFLRARRDRGVIVIALGPHGVASRVFFPLHGSLITYGFVVEAGAPGQLSLAELYAALRRYSPEFAATHAA